MKRLIYNKSFKEICSSKWIRN